MKVCKECQKEKDRSDFYPKYTNKDGLYTVCKQCHKAKTKAYKRAAVPKLTVSVPARCIPRWLTNNDWEAIKATYAESIVVSHQTGVKHVVDHIYPLRGTTVSGLHTPSNLRVVPEVANRKKYNNVLDSDETWV